MGSSCRTQREQQQSTGTLSCGGFQSATEASRAWAQLALNGPFTSSLFWFGICQGDVVFLRDDAGR